MVVISKNFVNSGQLSSKALRAHRLTQNLRPINSLLKLVNSHGLGKMQDIVNLKAYIKRYDANKLNITKSTLTDYSSYSVALALSLTRITASCITSLTNNSQSYVIVECFWVLVDQGKCRFVKMTKQQVL